MTRKCSKCKKEKHYDDFGYDKRYGVRSCCKRCRADREKDRRKSMGKDYFRILSVASTYKVSREKAKAMCETKMCEICGVEFTKNKKNVRSATGQAIDHCHQTGIIRGVICSGCNLALGHARDDKNILKSMIEYLQRFEDRALANLQLEIEKSEQDTIINE